MQEKGTSMGTYGARTAAEHLGTVQSKRETVSARGPLLFKSKNAGRDTRMGGQTESCLYVRKDVVHPPPTRL